MAISSSIERLPGSRVRCAVEFSRAQVAEHEKEALKRLASRVKIQGFRPGHAPEGMLREKIDAEQLFEETIRSLLPSTFESLLKEHNIQPIIHPKVEVQSRDPLKIHITFVERPEVTLKNVEGIRIEKKEMKADDKDVEKMVYYLVQQKRTFTESPEPSAAGDQVRLDFHGTDSAGKEIEGTRSQGYSVVIGSKTLIPGFEDALIGLKPGDEKSFTVTFPEKYHAEELRGKPATFHAKVLRVQHVKTPELTDAFAKEHFGLTTAAEMKETIRTKMRSEEEQIERTRREGELLEKIRAATDVTIAPELIEEEEHAVLEELDQQLKAQGLTAKDWMSQSKKDPVELKKDITDRAEKRIRLRLGLQKLVETKDKRLTDEDMAPLLQEFRKGIPEKDRATVEPRLRKGGDLYDRIKWQHEVQGVIEGMLAT